MTWSIDQSQGQYGDLTVDANTGQWHYHLNNHSAQTNALAEGEHHTEQFVISAIDSLGRKVNTVISVEVDGSNDLPTISGLHNASLNEMGNIDTVAGKLVDTDPDHGDSISWAVPQTLGQYGHLTIDQNTGVWIYQLDNNSPNTLALHAGEVATETFRVTATDSSGLPVSQIVTIAIHGTDEIAKINGVSSASLTEDKDVVSGQLHIDGQLNIIDPDAGQNQFQASALQGQFGALSIDSNGHWTYTADNSQAAIQGLRSGESLTEILYVHSVDGSEQKVTITINGNDDKAVIGGATTASVTEDRDLYQGQLRVDGALTVTDVDAGQSQFTATSLQGQFGTLSIDSNGHWTYTADNSQAVIQGLKSGESLTDTLLVHSVDGTSQKVTITINGNDDKAVIGGAATASVTEDKDVHSGQLRVDGALSVTDTDLGQSQFSATSLQGQFGSLSINSNGHWTYTADNSQTTIQGLKSGESLTDALIVHSVDGSEQKVMVTINGTDDKAIIGGTATASVTEDKDVHNGVLRVDGALTVSDADNNQAQFVATSMQGQYGDLSIDNNGHWSYTTNNANPQIQRLKSGDTVTDTLLVHSVDGSEQKVTIIINGTNDKAVIAGTVSASMTEDKDVHQGLLRVDGTLTVTDVDSGQNQFQASALQGQFGSLSLNELGHWTYTANNSQPAIQGLKTGESLTDTLIVHSVDGTEQKVTITINGTDDKAQISSIKSAGTATATLTEDKDVHQDLLRVDGALTVADVDLGQNQFQASALQGQFGTLTLNNLGHWTYTADNSQTAIQGLKSGESLIDTLIVHSADGTEQKVMVTINGTDDKAVITDTQPDLNLRGVTEDRGYIDTHYQLHYDGQLNIQDPDAGEAQFDPNIGPQTYQGIGYDTKLGGHLLLMQDGHYTYTLDNRNIQNLAEGEVKQDSVVIRSADGTTHTIDLTVHGTNDKPTIAAQSHSVAEGGNQLNGQMIGQDIDTGAQLHYSAPQTDGLTLNPDGSYSFSPNHSTYQSLASGASKTLTIPVTLTDEHNASSTQNLSITITGANNAATISGVTTGDVDEGHGSFGDMSPDYAQPGMAKLGQAGLTADGKLDIVDPDSGESLFDPKGGAWNNSYHGQYGHLLLNPDGTWHYHVTVGSVDWVGNRKTTIGTTIDELGEHQTLTDTITVYSKDGTTHDIVITIHGSNDRPYCSSEVVLQSGSEDTRQTLTTVQLLANTVDVDANDAGKLTIENLHADHGSILVNGDGTFTFTPEKNYNGSVHFSYDVKDAHGGVTHTGASTTLSAVGDKAQIAGVDTGSITENSAGVDMSPDYAQPGIATLGNTTLYADGKLTITDPDVGESGFERQGSNGYDYHGTYGDLILLTDGTWHYHADAGHLSGIGARPTTRGTAIDQLGEGQSLTDTITVHSKDGTTHDIVITIHGSNDRPYCSSEVVLANGSEDTRQTLTTAQLLANTVDVDKNDAGLLTIENLHADHGSILINGDGTFTFTPEKDYNGDVHFSYDVKDAHGGVIHTGASTSLAALDDKTIISGVGHGIATEDVATHMSTNVNILDAVDWQALQITDVDSPNQQVTVEFAGKQYTWDLGSNLDVTTPYGKFQFYTITYGPNTGEHCWSYIGDNSNVHVQELKQGESLTESIKLIATDGTEFPITVKVNGTEDGVVIDSKSELGHVVENAQAGASVAGHVVAHDVDLHDTVSWTQTPTTGISGQYGTFHLSTDGQWHYDVDQSKATKLGDGDEYWEHFTVEAVSTDGSHVSKSVSIVVHGNNDAPTVVRGEVTLPSGKEDTSIHITQAQLVANAIDVDANDRGWLHVENLTADHGSLVSNSDGSFTFNPDPNYNGAVHFSYDIADRHGGMTHTGATSTLTANNDNPDISPLTDSIKEGASHNLDLLTGATDIEGDTLHIEQLSYSIDGALSTAHLPAGLSLAADGHTLIVDATDPAFNHLANGQSQQIAITYQVEDGHGGSTQQTATLTIAGTDDKAALVSNVIQLTETQALDSEFKTYKGNLQLIDPDSGDNTQFVFSGKYLGQGYAPGHLDVWPDGSYQFRLEGASNRHADDLISSLHTGESMEIPYEVTTSDGQTLTIMVKVIGEDNQAKIAVTPYSSLNNHVYEDHTSFGNTTNQLSSGGTLHVIDPDHDQAGFIAQTITTAEGGRFNINALGHWSYNIENDKVQHLGAGESFQQTFTVESIDGSAQKDITVTVHGTNDAPVASAEVRLSSGQENTQIVLTTSQLLANTSDVDDNDAGLLTIENLHADHGSILINGDGTFTLTPEKDYNGDVHFSYDVKDAHGGVTHTGACTTLAAVNDAALINGQSQASSNVDIFEDGATSRLTGQLTLTDVDSGENQFATISQLAGQYGYLSMDQQGNWSYTLDNSLDTTNGLVAGQVVTESFTLTSPDGTASHTINVQIHGHDDTPSLSVNEGGAGKSLDLLGGLSSGTVSHMQFSTDGVHYTNQVPDGFMLASDGHTLQVDPAHNSYNHLANGIALKVDIKYELQQGTGSNVQTSQQQAQVVVTGTSDRPIIHSFTSNSQQNSGPVSGNLLQGATDVDDGAQLVLHDVQFQDPVTHHYVTVQAGQTHNITGVGVIAISANGDYTFTPNSQFSGQVPNLIYRVTDTHGDYADNSQNNLTIHIDPYQAPIIIAPLAIALAHDTGSSATDLITQDGALSISGQTAGMQVEYSTDGGTHWSTQFTPVEGLNQLQVRQTDAAGHTSTATSLDFTLDTKTPTPHISLDPITADNVLNQAELSGNLPITGTVGSEISVGNSITLTLGTHTYTGTVDAQHRFSIDVPANQLSSHTNISASVTITDTAGNSATATDNHHYSTDTNAAIRVNPITSDNIIEASEQQQAIDITGTVSGVEDGQTVTVSIGGHHCQALVAHGAWHTSLSAAEVQALQGGTIDVTASVHDLAGNAASIHTPLYVSDGSNPVPSLSFKTPPTPTGGGSIGSHISGDLVAPPLIQQLTPNLPSGGWAISDGNGHTSTSLHGQYGTLTIDPVTGHVDYVYNQAPTPGNKAAGGTHWAGQTTSEEHHDIFQVVYHDAHASNVDVKVNLDVTYIHGHSGQNQSSTHLVEMTVTPAASTPPPLPAPDMHDTPQDDETSVVVIDELDIHDDAMAHRVDGDASPKSDIEQPPEVSKTSLPLPATNAPIDHYLQMVGLSQGDVPPPSNSQMGSDLPAVITLTDSDPYADMLDTSAHDHFDNPLSDEDQHKEEHAAIIDETIDHMDHQANDDDLLHSALNDMHNQT